MPESVQEQVEELLKQARSLFETGTLEAGIEVAERACELARKGGVESELVLAEGLSLLGDQHAKSGDPTMAVPLNEEALKIRRERLGESAIEVAENLANLVSLYIELENYAAAEPLCRQHLQILGTHQGEDHPEAANDLETLAFLYQMMGNFAEAEPLCRQRLQILRKHLGEDHPDVAASLDALAQVYTVLRHHVAAEQPCKQALEIRRKHWGDDHPDVIRNLSDLADVYARLNDVAAAEPLYKQVLERRREHLGEDHADVAATLGSLADLYVEMDDHGRAEPLYKRALEIHRACLGEDHLEVATTLDSLAGLYAQMNDYAAAESFYKEALEIRSKHLGEDHADVASALDRLAGLYQDVGDEDAAQPLLRRALDIRQKQPREAESNDLDDLVQMADLRRALGEPAAAATLYEKALEDIRKGLGEDYFQVPYVLRMLSLSYVSLGNHAAAERYLRQELEIHTRHQTESHVTAAAISQCMTVLADLLCWYMGDYPAARPLYEEALAIRRRHLDVNHHEIVRSLANLAHLFVASSLTDHALEALQQLLPLEDWLLQRVFAIGSERRRAAYLTKMADTYPLLLTLASRSLAGSPDAARTALDYTLRRKALQTEALSVQRDLVLGGRYEALAPKLRELSMLRAQIAQKTLAGPGDEGLEGHRKMLQEWSARQEALDEELVRQIPEMSLDRTLRSATRNAVADALPAGSVLVEFACFTEWEPRRAQENPTAKSRYLALVLHAGAPDPVELVDLGDAATIDGLVADFRSAVTGRRETAASRDLGWNELSQAPAAPRAGERLRAAVFDPLVRALGERRALFLAPDGELCRLPFEALPAAEGEYLIDKYHIRYLTSGRDVLRFGARSAVPPTKPVVVADPDFDLAADDTTARQPSTKGRQSSDLDPSAIQFDRLPGLRQEGQEIANRLGVTPWLGDEATEGRVKALRSPRILHIATHGFFLSNQPDPRGAVPEDGIGRLLSAGRENPLLRSGLALAGANTWLRGGALPEQAEDGLLNGEDVAAMDLVATDLVVLSACETGLGEIRLGEGVYGLRRAFTVAGARTLVMSLWKVPDRETAELMEAFYEGLSQDLGPADALREAQRKLREKRPEPYYWGAFICQGDPGA